MNSSREFEPSAATHDGIESDESNVAPTNASTDDVGVDNATNHGDDALYDTSTADDEPFQEATALTGDVLLENPSTTESNATLPDDAVTTEVPGLIIDAAVDDTLGTQRSRRNPPSSRSSATARTEALVSTSSARSTHADDPSIRVPSSSRSMNDDLPSTRSRPHSQHSTARSRHVTSRLELAVETAEKDDVVRDSAAFDTWTAPPMASTASDGPYKIGPFVLLLLDEFCRHYALTDTTSALHKELQELGVAFPASDVWFDMHGQCRSILGNTKHTNALAQATTIERLIQFCVNPQARKAVFALDMVAAHSPMHVCASPKRVTSTSSNAYSLRAAYQQTQSPIVRPSQRTNKNAMGVRSLATPLTHHVASREDPVDDASEPEDNQQRSTLSPSRVSESPVRKASMVSVQKKKKKRKSRQHRSHSVVSVVSHASGYHAPAHQHQVPPGTYGEPVLVEAHLTDLKRDLTSTRLLERELRHVRLEKLLTTPTISTQKKLGFHTLTTDEQRTRQQLQDPYANELVLEKYGFSKRQDCALCQFPFLLYNLPHKVSFKCIMDVYDHWRFVPPDRDTASRYKPPLCYDAVHVCRMCAQIVFQHAKQPEAQLLLAATATTRPLSRKHKKAKSLANLHTTMPTSDDASFCSDPYALPPLLGDDVYDHRDALGPVVNGRRRGVRGDGDAADGAAAMGESPAKAIVYSQQVDGAPFMTAKEWEVINPEKSSTRHRIQATLAAQRST